MDINTAIELLFVIFAGLSFGSFVTLASYRLPLDEDIIIKPSRCPRCNTPLKMKDLFPVLSWVASKGKCRHCHEKISARYPATEIVTASAFLLVYAEHGLTIKAALLAMLAVALLIMIVADLEHYIIPDEVHVALLPLGLLYHFVVGTAPELVLYGFLVGLATGMILHHGYRFLRKKEGLGYGDVKFMAVAGIWLTLYPFVPFLFYSGAFGVVMGLVWRLIGKGPVFPFGPSLALALFLGVAVPEFTNLFWDMLEITR